MRYGFYFRSGRNTESVDFPRGTGQLSPSSGVTHGTKSKVGTFVRSLIKERKCRRRKGRFPVKADGHQDKQTRNETKGRRNEETAPFRTNARCSRDTYFTWER